MADLEDIKIRKEARKAAFYHVGELLNTLFPTHKILQANKNYSIPDSPYITVRILSDGIGNTNTGFGLTPIRVDIDEFGDQSSYYHVTQSYRVKWHKDDAMDHACDFIERVGDEVFRRDWFTGDFGITGLSDALDSPTSIDYDSSWEEGAVVTFSINYLFKYEYVDSGTIDKVSFTATTVDGDNKLDVSGNAQNYWIDLGYPTIQEYIAESNNTYAYVNSVDTYSEDGLDFSNDWM